MSDFSEWKGRTVSEFQRVEGWPMKGMDGLLQGRANVTTEDGQPLHPCAHWMYFVPAVPQDAIDVDGHPRRGGLIPPLPQARRMWAGSRLTYGGDLRIGDMVEKRSTLSGISSKAGKSGPLVFLEINHQYLHDGSVVREEIQTLVYRDHQPYDDAVFSQRAQHAPDWSVEMTLGAVELFRYSALTFNGHRIHYDADYTRDVEGYPGVIVQGQLLATLLVSQALAQAGAVRCSQFAFKAVKPLFADQPFHLEGRRLEDGGIDAWVRQPDGLLHMTAAIAL